MVVLNSTILLSCIVLPILTAISGVWAAKQKGEKIVWALFVKTIAIGLVAAGIMSASDAELLVAIFGVEVVTVVLDKLLNAALNKYQRTLPG